jgi:hypothetical protein
MKTVKAYDTKTISPRELFSLTYSTKELFTFEKIEEMKCKIIESLNPKGEIEIEFFENEGVVFYCSSFKENGKKLTTINDLKDYSIISGGELWKFGFVNRKTGNITLLFGGHFIARNRQEAFKYFEIAEVVTSNKFEDSKDLIAFAIKD